MNVEFETLLGIHKLSGVSFEQIHIEGDYEQAQACNFILDGVTYTAIEDPDDGYRSTMRQLIVSDTKLKNMFKPVKVLVMKRPEHRYGDDYDVLDFVDVVTAKIVLSVGTDHTDDYYPSFVSEWHPENLVHNQGVTTPE